MVSSDIQFHAKKEDQQIQNLSLWLQISYLFILMRLRIEPIYGSRKRVKMYYELFFMEYRRDYVVHWDVYAGM